MLYNRRNDKSEIKDSVIKNVKRSGWIVKNGNVEDKKMGEQNYNVGDYQTMSIAEKIDFLYKVHREEIFISDEDGNDNEFYNDYHSVQDELLEHSEILCCEDILHIMKIFYDDCFEVSWQFHLASMVFSNCQYYGKDRISFYLQHLQEVPSNGRFHGWHFPVQWLMDEQTFPMLKEAIQEQTEEIQKLILEILGDIDIYPAQKEELKALINK